MTPDTDAYLVARVLEGDADRYAVLVGRYQDSLFRYAVGMVRDGDLASDLVQDSFVKAYTSLASCQDPNRFGAWVFRILVNRCKDHLKSRRRHTLPLEEDTATTPDSDNPAISADRADMRQMVERALATLPEAQREAFLLKHLEGHSYEEMAEMLGASVSALKMRVLRAREALQGLLRELAD
ncbi:MAG TPA: sigma-70 family RNA polymerase sigma factor [Longimicrobiaceae bacterium]|nr:sigma-70 family RNA polymerase sigma factor [Longimicrobiaceae bacterium]